MKGDGALIIILTMLGVAVLFFTLKIADAIAARLM